jgi:uncharacterized SAM-binding protein YcdF (DUF218 family)
VSPSAFRPVFQVSRNALTAFLQVSRNASAAFLQGRKKLLLIGAFVCAVLGAGGYLFAELGHFMAREDPLQKADAIFVFAGRYVERPLEAADLYQDGYAPRIVITRSTADQQIFGLKPRQIRVPSEYDLTTDMLQQLGIPAAALVTPTFIHDNTAEEARTLRELALLRGWRRVIVVSSKYHLRRITVAVRNQLRGTAVEVLARGSRYDQSMPDRWWTRRSDVRQLATEVPKLIAYTLGVGL